MQGEQNNNPHNIENNKKLLYTDNPLFEQVNQNKYELPIRPLGKLNNQNDQNIEQHANNENNDEQVNNNDFPRVSSSSSISRSSRQSHQQQSLWQYSSIKQGQKQQQEQQHKQNNLAQNQQGQPITSLQNQNPNQATQKDPNRIIRYKYCCKKCKHADRDKDKKACVCVVPRDQRRTNLGNQGCQTCGCDGCSKQDFIFRGQDPQYHPEQNKQNKKQHYNNNNQHNNNNFQARNGCCKNCMKAFSKSNKSCICQVPQSVRKTKLSSAGCKICGCVGCNPEDKRGYKDDRRRRSRSRSQKRKTKKKSRSREKKKRSKSRSPEIIDELAMNFYNIDRSIIDPALLGFGIPQRSNSYLFGKNKEK